MQSRASLRVSYLVIVVDNVLTEVSTPDGAASVHRGILAVHRMAQLSIQEAFDLAMQHHRAGRLEDAELIYQEILAQQPAHFGAMHFLGVSAHQRGRNDIAVDLIRKAIAVNPNVPEAHNNLGIAFLGKGDFDRAITAFRGAIALDPALAEVHNNLGNALAGKGQLNGAIAAYRQAIALKPGYIDACNNLGNALRDNGQLDEAIAAYRQVIAWNPKWPGANYNLGNVLMGKGELDEAIAAFRRALDLDPTFADAYNNLGNALGEKGQLDEAITAHRQAIALNPDYPEAYCNLGTALREKGSMDAAIAAALQAIALRPDFAEAHYNLATALLTQGDFERGWEEYEWRWKCKGLSSQPRHFPRPYWDGSALSDETTLLIHTEQGLGDAIQFIRYLPMVAERGGRIVLECQPELQWVFQTVARTIKGDCRIVLRGEALPRFDLQCPLLSLPRIFKSTLASIPARVPYLFPERDRIGAWRKRLDASSDDLKVGLNWAGNPANQNDRGRSLSLDLLAPLAAVRGVTFYSLQKGVADSQAKEPPSGMKFIDWTAEVSHFSDDALIANLDLTITSDTSVAHLAGALARPTWVLLPFAADWRWLRDRDDSPWYPTMRLFRQNTPGDWDGVIRRVGDELARMSSQG